LSDPEQRSSSARTDEPLSQLGFRTHPVSWSDLRPDRRRRHKATHEAGHAVVGAALGFAVIDVDINLSPTPHPDGGLIAGGTRFDAPGGDIHALARERPAETAIALMAGLCSEEVILGAHLRESWIGDLRILRIGHGWTDGPREMPSEIVSYLNEAHETVTRNRNSIQAVAEQLHETGYLTGAQVKAIYAA
jgi:ATP-dependent Zn protease